MVSTNEQAKYEKSQIHMTYYQIKVKVNVRCKVCKYFDYFNIPCDLLHFMHKYFKFTLFYFAPLHNCKIINKSMSNFPTQHKHLLMYIYLGDAFIQSDLHESINLNK